MIAGRRMPDDFVRGAHKEWYRETVPALRSAGLIEAGAIWQDTVTMPYICARRVCAAAVGSRYVRPCRRCSISRKRNLSLRCAPCFGHWLFGYIHPYPDGNGRMARFVMNAMLASGGYPWTMIRVRDRKTI